MSTRNFTAYKLYFTTPLHLGDRRDDYGISLRTMSSDAFYAAITATLAKMGEDLPNDGDLGCIISSLFPFFQQNEKDRPVFFFPAPLYRLSSSTERLKYQNSKKIKSICWLDDHYFQKVINGGSLFSTESDVSNINGSFLSVTKVPDGFISSSVSSMVTVSRSFEDARPFYMDRVLFLGHSGLFFLAEGDTSHIDKALPLLSIEGIGTDRNVGNGQFQYEKVNICLTCPDVTNLSLVLSTLIPEDKDQLESMLTGEKVAYELMRLGGWISTPPYLTLRKNAIYAFASGSVFSGLQSGCGKIVDLAPDKMVSHPIWRCGKAIVLPIQLA